MLIQDSETALILATKNNHVEVVKTLVSYGAAVDIRNKVQAGIHEILSTKYQNLLAKKSTIKR